MERKTKLTAGQIVVETLIREGVPCIVGILGHGTLGPSDALLEDEPISPDITALARAFGCHDERISAPDEERSARAREGGGTVDQQKFFRTEYSQ